MQNLRADDLLKHILEESDHNTVLPKNIEPNINFIDPISRLSMNAYNPTTKTNDVFSNFKGIAQ